jgi:hypothetical protein
MIRDVAIGGGVTPPPPPIIQTLVKLVKMELVFAQSWSKWN